MSICRKNILKLSPHLLLRIFLLDVKRVPVVHDPLFSEALRIRNSMFPFDQLMHMDCHPV